MPQLPLDSLLAAAVTGDAGAWRDLVDRFGKRVFALLVKHCSDRELAEEITQATFVQIATHLDGYQEQGRFEPWLFRIAMNLLRDEMRRRKRHARPMDMTGGRGEDDSGGDTAAWQVAQEKLVRDAEGSDHEDPAERVSRAEQVALIQSAIAGMNPADRTIIELRHTAGLSFAEIAENLGEPLGTVLARGHRALAKLKKLVAGEEEEVRSEE